MKQSKSMSALETTLSTMIGFGISFLAQLVFLPMLGVPIQLGQNTAFALIMTAISLGRGFALRRLFEALHIRNPVSPGMLAIAAERRRQTEVEGWTLDHDDQYPPGELAEGAASYAMVAFEKPASAPPALWPWETSWWKPHEPRRNLIRAGALILAEIEKLDRNRSKRRAPVKPIMVSRDREPWKSERGFATPPPPMFSKTAREQGGSSC